jgi:hypothetical protein
MLVKLVLGRLNLECSYVDLNLRYSNRQKKHLLESDIAKNYYKKYCHRISHYLMALMYNLAAVLESSWIKIGFSQFSLGRCRRPSITLFNKQFNTSQDNDSYRT